MVVRGEARAKNPLTQQEEGAMNRIETKLIDIALLPLKAVLWLAVVIFCPAPIRIIEHPDRPGYRLDTCPEGMCPHSDGLEIT